MMKHCPWEHDVGGCPKPCLCTKDVYCLYKVFAVFDKLVKKKRYSPGFRVVDYGEWVVQVARGSR